MRGKRHYLFVLPLPWILLVGSCAVNGVQPVVKSSKTPEPATTAVANRTVDSGRDPVAKELRPELTKVKGLTSVPVLLPDELPHPAGDKPLYTYSEGDANEYKITLGSEPKCGANACLLGVFQAQRGEEAPEADEVDRVVDLANGIKGYYTAKSCGASCAPPQIQWLYEGVLYTIQFRVGSKDDNEDETIIMGMANSAIKAVAR